MDLGPETRPERPHHAERLFRDRTVQQPDRPQDGKAPDAFVSHKDNFRNFLQQGLTTSNNVSISHKFKEGSFRISLNQLYRRGQTPNTDLKRFGVNGTANYNITGRLHISRQHDLQLYLFPKPSLVRLRHIPHPYYNILVYMGANNDIRDLRNYWEEGQEGYAQRNWNHVLVQLNP